MSALGGDLKGPLMFADARLTAVSSQPPSRTSAHPRSGRPISGLGQVRLGRPDNSLSERIKRWAKR